MTSNIQLTSIENAGGAIKSVFNRFQMHEQHLRAGGDADSPHLMNLDSTYGYDWHKEISGEIEGVSRETSQFVQGLIDMGNVTPINFGTTLAGYQYRNDVIEPAVSLNPNANIQKDRQRYAREWLPIPIVHAEFSVGAVEEAAGAANGHSQANDMVMDNVENIQIKLDELAILGGFRANDQETNSNELYGAVNHPNRIRKTGLTVGAWNGSRDDSNQNVKSNGEVVYDEMLEIIQLFVAKNFRGDADLLIPRNWVSPLKADYSRQKNGGSIWEKLMSLPEVASIKQVDQLPDNECLFVMRSKKFVDVAVGSDLVIAPFSLNPYESQFCIFVKMGVRWKKVFDPEGSGKSAVTTGIIHASS